MTTVAEPPLVAPYSQKLPLAFRDERVLSAISSDGQLYVELGDEGAVARVESWQVNPRLLEGAGLHELLGKSTKTRKQKDKKKRGLAQADYRILRHLVHEHRVCRDCSAQADAVHFLWSERRCGECGSTHIEVECTNSQPPLPASIRNVGEPLISARYFPKESTSDHVWGEDLSADARALVELCSSYRFADNGHHHLYLLLSFAQTLSGKILSDGAPEAFNFILNWANVAQRAFELSGDPEHARTMLDCFERAINWLSDPVPVGLAKHSFGMATHYLLLRYGEAEADSLTGRTGLRGAAVRHVREALTLFESLRGDPARGSSERIEQQVQRVRYALADLLRDGEPTAEELDESVALFQALGDNIDAAIRPFVLVARAETMLRKELQPDMTEAAIERVFGALKEILTVLKDKSPGHLRHRGRWAMVVGEALLAMGDFKGAMLFLESGLTYTVKDTPHQVDPRRATHDAELHWRVFSSLATLYTNIGWWFEALSMLETYRGHAIELASLDPLDRSTRTAKAEATRAERFFGMFATPDDSPSSIMADESVQEELSGHRLGPFGEDYELPGLSDRLLDLFDQLSDESTALVSLNVGYDPVRHVFVMSAITLGPPVKPARPAAHKVWTIDAATFGRLTGTTHTRPSSFREQRLRALAEIGEKHLIDPVRELLVPFDCQRVLMVAPSRLSNLPVEAFIAGPKVGSRDRLPTHVAFTPSFMFGAGYDPRKTRSSISRLLIVGYSGADLPRADDEAKALMSLFGDRVTYLTGSDCTKRRVVDALNANFDYVHFICHGTYDAQLPGQSAMYFSECRDADGFRLLAWEVRELVRLRARPMITLSACSTALTADSRSNTWHGLPGSFLEAGARCIIGSRWPVTDRVAQRFMTGLYRRMQEGRASPLACFHATQDELRRDSPTEAWACFGYLGLP